MPTLTQVFWMKFGPDREELLDILSIDD